MQIRPLLFTIAALSSLPFLASQASAAPAAASTATLPLPENISLPQNLSAFVSMRLSRMHAVLDSALLPGESRKTLESIQPFESLCGLPMSGITTICFANRASDGKGALLVSAREPVSLEKTVTAMALAAESPAVFGEWRQVTLKSGGQPAILAVQTGPTDLLLLHTTKPHLETPASIAALAKDLSTARAAVAGSQAAIWGRTTKPMEAKDLAGGCLSRLGTLADLSKPLHFDIHMDGPGNGLELRFTVPHQPADNNPGLVERVEKIIAAAKTEGLQNPPSWKGVQNKDTLSCQAAIPLGLLAEMADDILKSTISAKSRRNAQNVASCYAAARAAGCTDFEGIKDVAKIIALLNAGVKPSTGRFSNSTFRVELSADDATAATPYLSITKDGLEFAGAGNAAPASPNKEAVFDLVGNVFQSLAPESPYENGPRALAKARRNAQSLASAAAAARAAGATAFDNLKDVSSMIKALNTGVNGTGQFSTTTFRVKLETAEALAAARYLKRQEDGNLIYKPGLEE